MKMTAAAPASCNAAAFVKNGTSPLYNAAPEKRR
jgi:hypothetical protein